MSFRTVARVVLVGASSFTAIVASSGTTYAYQLPSLASAKPFVSPRVEGLRRVAWARFGSICPGLVRTSFPGDTISGLNGI